MFVHFSLREEVARGWNWADEYRRRLDSIFEEEQREKIKRVAAGLLLGLMLTPFINVLHEEGHALAARCVFVRPNPKIVLPWIGFGEGQCQLESKHPSSLGLWLGENATEALVSAAGPLANSAAALVMMVFFRSDGARSAVLVGCLQVTCYALSDFFLIRNGGACQGRDFCNVAQRGGFVAYAVLSALPITLTIFNFRRVWSFTRGVVVSAV